MSSPSTTTTSVINVKVANLRQPQRHNSLRTYNNLKEWIEADTQNHVYIGRPGVVFVNGVRFPPPGLPSSKMFSNPFKITVDGKKKKDNPTAARTTSMTRDEVVEAYRKYALERIKIDAEFREGVFALKGKILGCWCAPLKCHGDVLKEIADSMSQEEFVKLCVDGKRRRREREEDNGDDGDKFE